MVSSIQDGIFEVLFWGLLILKVWGLADCLARKNAAFPAAGKLTKAAWTLLNVASVGLSLLVQNALNIVPLVALVVTLVYLTDVRPAVREVSGGSRW